MLLAIISGMHTWHSVAYARQFLGPQGLEKRVINSFFYVDGVNCSVCDATNASFNVANKNIFVEDEGLIK